jgi:hypothetical protein
MTGILGSGALLGAGDPRTADDLRRTGTRLLRQSLAEVKGPVAALTAVNLVGLASTVLLPAALASAVDAVITGAGPGRPLAQLALLLALLTLHDALDDLIASGVGASMTARLRLRLLRRALSLGVPVRRLALPALRGTVTYAFERPALSPWRISNGRTFGGRSRSSRRRPTSSPER